MSRKRCNTRIVSETAAACAPCSPQARHELIAAKRAARDGNCALMHRHAQYARAILQLDGRR
jgi:hypothetical protein